ncbi:MAG: hypothetical protein ACKV19_15385 [Verrucomicrobiales bacterium]
MATLIVWSSTLSTRAQLPVFRAWFEDEADGKKILVWPTGPYRQYEVERSTDLFSWTMEAALYRTTGSAQMRRHVLTIVPSGATPPPVVPPSTKDPVLFTLRRIGADYIATWEGLDGVMYSSGSISGVPTTPLPVSEHDWGNYRITTIVTAPATEGVVAPTPSTLPAPESARLAAFTASISQLATTTAPEGQTAVVSANGTYWRVRELQDSDGDGLTDLYEATVLHSDIFLWDSDGDGTDDGTEYANSRSALDSTDADPATFALDWKQTAGLNAWPHGYASGLNPSAPFNLYRKRVTVRRLRKNGSTFTSPTLNSYVRDDVENTVTEEVTSGGALHYEASSGTYEPTLKWNYSHTRGADLPGSNTTLFGLPTAAPLVSGDRYQFSATNYEGTWNYESATLTNHMVSAFKEWPEGIGEIVTQKRRNWTATSSTNITVTGTTTVNRTPGSFYLLPSLTPTPVWTSETTAAGGSATTTPNDGWTTITLSDKVTYATHRANVLALNYSGASVIDASESESADARYTLTETGVVGLQKLSFRLNRINTNAGIGEQAFSGATNVDWTETFTPTDDPATTSVDEAANLPETRYYSWSASRGATGSPTFVINPAIGRFSGGPTGSDKGGVALGTTVLGGAGFDLDVDANMDKRIDEKDESLEDKVPQGATVAERGVILDVNNDNTDATAPQSPTKATADNENSTLDSEDDRADLDSPEGPGHRFGRLQLTVTCPPTATAWEYWLVAENGLENSLRVFDDREWLTASPTVPFAWIEPYKSQAKLDYTVLFPDPSQRRAGKTSKLNYVMEGITYGSGRLRLERRSPNGTVQATDSVWVTVNVDQYVNTQAANSLKAYSLSGQPGFETDQSPLGKQPNYLGYRYSPNLTLSDSPPPSVLHIVAVRGRVTARIPSYRHHLNGSSIMNSWAHIEPRNLQTATFWVGIRDNSNPGSWVQTGLRWKQDLNERDPRQLSLYLETGAQHAANSIITPKQQFAFERVNENQGGSGGGSVTKILQGWDRKSVVYDFILCKTIGDPTTSNPQNWHALFRDARALGASSSDFTQLPDGDYLHLDFGEPTTSNPNINDQLRTVFNGARMRELEVEFESTQSISFAPGMPASPGKVEQLRIATIRLGAAQPSNSSGAKAWFHWAIGNTADSAEFNWFQPDKPTGSSIRLRTGQVNAGSNTHQTDLGNWHLQIDPSSGNLSLWDDRIWGFYQRPQ